MGHLTKLLAKDFDLGPDRKVSPSYALVSFFVFSKVLETHLKPVFFVLRDILKSPKFVLFPFCFYSVLLPCFKNMGAIIHTVASIFHFYHNSV